MTKEQKKTALEGRLAHLGARTHKQNDNIKKKVLRQIKSLL